jgi:ankyrin repeat protein
MFSLSALEENGKIKMEFLENLGDFKRVPIDVLKLIAQEILKDDKSILKNNIIKNLGSTSHAFRSIVFLTYQSNIEKEKESLYDLKKYPNELLYLIANQVFEDDRSLFKQDSMKSLGSTCKIFYRVISSLYGTYNRENSDEIRQKLSDIYQNCFDKGLFEKSEKIIKHPQFKFDESSEYCQSIKKTVRIHKNIKHIDFCNNGALIFLDSLIEAKKVSTGSFDNYFIQRACSKGWVKKVRELLANPTIDPSVNHQYPIRIASQRGHLEIVKLLLKDPRVDPSEEYNEAIRLAVENGHVEIVKLLLADPRVDPSRKNNEAIRLAVENGHVEIVKLLLKDPRVDPSEKNNEAIRLAVENNHIEIVKLLLTDPRVDPSRKNNEAIRLAIRNRSMEIVKLLLTHPRVDPNGEDNQVIQLAVENNHIEIVKLLLTDARFKKDGYNKINYYLEEGKINDLIILLNYLLEKGVPESDLKRFIQIKQADYSFKWKVENKQVIITKIIYKHTDLPNSTIIIGRLKEWVKTQDCYEEKSNKVSRKKVSIRTDSLFEKIKKKLSS